MTRSFIYMACATLLLTACGSPELPLGDAAREKCTSLKILPKFPRPDALVDLKEVRVDYDVGFSNLDGSPLTEVLYVKLPDSSTHILKLDKQDRLKRPEDVLFAPEGSALCRATINGDPLRAQIDSRFNSLITLTEVKSEYPYEQLRRAADEADYISRLIAGNAAGIPPMNQFVVVSRPSKPSTVEITLADGSRQTLTGKGAGELSFYSLDAMGRAGAQSVSVSPAPENILIAFRPDAPL